MPFSDAKLGETDTVFELSTSRDAAQAAAQLAREAHRSVIIHSRHLDRRVYDTTNFLDAIQRLVTTTSMATVRVLVQDPSLIVQHGHRMVHLAHRLSSFIQIKKTAEEFSRYNDAFLVVDDTAVMIHRPADRYEGTVSFNAAGEAKELLRYFDRVWEHSQPDPALKRLHL